MTESTWSSARWQTGMEACHFGSRGRGSRGAGRQEIGNDKETLFFGGWGGSGMCDWSNGSTLNEGGGKDNHERMWYEEKNKERKKRFWKMQVWRRSESRTLKWQREDRKLSRSTTGLPRQLPEGQSDAIGPQHLLDADNSALRILLLTPPVLPDCRCSIKLQQGLAQNELWEITYVFLDENGLNYRPLMSKDRFKKLYLIQNC